MATMATNETFRVDFDGKITADVYVKQEKIASPNDNVEVGDMARGHKTLCRVGNRLYWIENSALDVR